MKRLFFLLIINVFVVNILLAQNPSIQCLSVSEEGMVHLSWVNHPTDFMSGEVFYKNENTPNFSVMYNFSDESDTSWDDVNAGANYQKTWYFIRNVTESGIFVSDTFQTYFLEAELLDDTHIKLAWNTLYENEETQYSIFREQQGEWEEIAVSDTAFYIDPLEDCADNFRYRIHSGECYSSNISVQQHDDNAPSAPIFDSVSVVDNQVILGWQRSTSEDAAGYRILKQQPLGWDPVMEINDPDILYAVDTFFTDFCTTERIYCVITIDRCGNSTPINEAQQRHHLIFQPVTLDICGKRILLSWSPFEMYDLAPQLGGYRILYSQDGGPFQLDSIAPPNASSYIFDHPERNSHYVFKIQAINNTFTKSSTSCKHSIFAALPKEPEFGYIRYASVQNGFVDLCFEVDTQASSPSYEIRRSETGTEGSFQTIQTLHPTGASLLCTTDSMVDVNQYSYFYQLHSLDSCSHILEAPLIARSILLTTETNTQSDIELHWTSYEGFLDGTSKYLIYRKIDNDTFVFVTETTDIAYVDDSREAESYQNALWYRVAAVSNGIESDTAWSNPTQFLMKSFSVFFPNAFRPSGSINNVFRPIFVGISVKTYLFIIYNRWGDQIFSTDKQGEGWKGKASNGKDCDAGTYVYQFLMTDMAGNRYQKTGCVVLLH